MSIKRYLPHTYCQIEVPFEFRNSCFYCGEPSDNIDHFPPVNRYSDYFAIYDKHPPLSIPSCRECNRLLSDSIQEDIYARFEYCKKLLMSKLSKIVRLSELWDEDSLEYASFTGEFEKFSKSLDMTCKIANSRVNWEAWTPMIEGKEISRSSFENKYQINGKSFSNIDSAFVYARKVLKIPIPYLESVLGVVGVHRLQYAINICNSIQVKSQKDVDRVVNQLIEDGESYK